MTSGAALEEIRGRSGRWGGFQAALAGGVDVFELGVGDAGEGDAHRGVAGGPVRSPEIHGVFPKRLV